MAVLIVWACVMLGAAGIKLSSQSPQRKIAVVSHCFEDDGADEILTLNHLPKAGGQFLKNIIGGSLKSQNTNIENEDESLKLGELSATFVVGLIRNPFHWYISLWSYNSGGQGSFREALTPKQRDEYLGNGQGADRVWGDSGEDVERFRKWIRLINHEEMGLLTYRFFFSYVSQPSGAASSYSLTSTARKEIQRNSSLLDAMEHGYRAATRQICWVHTENIVNDIRGCLEEYESPSGRGSLVDWGRFEELAASSGHNPSNHAACSTFYDQGTIDYVVKSDRHVFEAFNHYLGQCQP
jgi:hypothetical protein